MRYTIKVDNMTFSNTTNNYGNSFNLSTANQVIKLNVAASNSGTTYYWLNVPPTFAAVYNGTIIITGVKNGEPPPP